MDNKYFVNHFFVMYENETVAEVITNGFNDVKIKKFTNELYKQPFFCDRQDAFYVYDFVKSRCYEDDREDLPDILKQFGLKNNNPWQWIHITHGVTYDDFFWVRFPGEIIKWEDVKIRE